VFSEGEDENWGKISFHFGRGEAKEAQENHD